MTNNTSDYWTIVQRGAAQADKEFPKAEVPFLRPSDGTTQQQRSIMLALLQKGVQGIAVSPGDPQHQTAVLNQIASRTNLITVDIDAPESKRLCYIGTDEYKSGRMAGLMMKKAVPQGGAVALFVGLRTSPNASERERGIRDELRHSRLQIVEVLTDDADRFKARSNAAVALTKYPKLAGMIGIWSYNGPDALVAVRQAHKVGQVKIVGFEEDTDTLNGVKEGGIYATVVQNPYQFGYQSIKLLDQLSHGDRSGIPASRKIFVPSRVVQRSNVDAFRKQRDIWLGRP